MCSNRLPSLAALLTLTLITAVHAGGGPSSRPGIGAIPYADESSFGVTFRVWAPNADAVSVAGSFNGWNDTADPLFTEGNGYWSLDRDFVFTGSEYKYVITNGATDHWKNDARATRLSNSLGPSLVYDQSSFAWTTEGYHTPAWHEMVIYEMHLGTFNVTDGTLPGRFDEAIERLDYLQDLGINMIEIMPVNEFPGDQSWGYNPSYPFAVESSYGGPDGFKAFIDAAHARGIGVIVDVVHNHYGPTDLDLWQFDGWSSGGWGGIYFYNDGRAQTPWGDTRPDFGRGEVRSYIRDNMLMWLNEYRADGLRVDAVQYMRKEFPGGPDLGDGWSLLQWINDDVDATQPWKIMIAEDLAEEAYVTKTTGEGGAGFDSQASTFFRPVRDAVIASNDHERDMWAVRNAITAVFNGTALQRVIYTENHDEVANGHSRVPEEIWPGNADSWYSRKRSTLGGTVVMTAPGIPMMFQGQEFLEDGYFNDAEALDWSRLESFPGVHQLYRDLIHLRRNFGDATRGLRGNHVNVHHVNDGDKMIAYHRWDQGGVGDDVVVMLNFANTTWPDYRIGLPHGGTWHVVFNSDSTQYGADYGDYGPATVTADGFGWDGMPNSASLSIAPYSALILSRKPLDVPPPTPDLDGSGVVDFADLVALLAAWGTAGPGDLNEDGTVGFADLVALLGAWGPLA